METLQMLEQRIGQLIDLVRELQHQIKTLKADNESLMLKNNDLAQELDQTKSSLLTSKEVLEEEKTLARIAVDELIKNIDSLVSHHDQL